MPPDTRRQDSPLVAVIRLRPVIPFQYGPRIHNSVPDPRRLLVFGPITLYASMIVCVSGYALTTAIGVSKCGFSLPRAKTKLPGARSSAARDGVTRTATILHLHGAPIAEGLETCSFAGPYLYPIGCETKCTIRPNGNGIRLHRVAVSTLYIVQVPRVGTGNRRFRRPHILQAVSPWSVG